MNNYLSKSFLVGFLGLFLTVSANAGVVSYDYDLPDISDSRSTSTIHSWFTTDVLNGVIESFDLSFSWEDQGWGNRKGAIFARRDGSNWVRISGIAEHFVTQEHITEIPNIISRYANDVIEFGYRVGGGGGHRLFVDNAQLSLTAVPAPPALAMFSIGLLGLGALRKRVKKTQ